MRHFKKSFLKFITNQRFNRIIKVYEKKISLIEIKNKTLIDPKVIKEHIDKWQTIFNKKINPKWLTWYISSSNAISPDYIPESIFYSIVEPILNDYEFSISYADKNFYDLFYQHGIFPNSIIRNIDGCFFNYNYEPLQTTFEIREILSRFNKFIVKPAIESGGGKNVELYRFKNDKFISSKNEVRELNELITIYGNNFLIQEHIEQHPFLESFNNTSLNTLRVLTLKIPSSNQIEILQVILRVGKDGEIIDNSRAGGYAIGVNKFDGRLNNFATNKYGQKFSSVNTKSLTSNVIVIPFFNDIIEMAKKIASNNIHHRLCGLDLTIDNNNKVRCLEINNAGNEINFYQLNNGPLFEHYTNEIIKYCKDNFDKIYNTYKF